MDIQINITEEEIKEQIAKSLEEGISNAVNRLLSEDERAYGYREILDRATDGAIEMLPKYVELEKDRLTEMAAERLAQALRISNHDILTALIALSENKNKY